MAELDVLAEAAATHPEGSEGGSPQPTANGGGRGRQRRGQQPARAGSSARGGSPSGATSAPLSKALVAAQVEQEHRARLSEGSDNALVQWATAVHEEVAGADKAFLAARDAHRAADAERAAARDAFRADQRNEQRSAEWHAKVAAAHAAHEALREARDALYRLQALAELLARELQRRRAAAGGGAALPGGGGGGAAAAQVDEKLLVPPAPQGTKRKRGAPPEQCPFCGHGYTVRDGLSNQLDAAGGRLHLRRCQCRKKTPPCRNCPECRQRPDVMQLAGDAAAAYELCQRVHACAVCACKCPAAGKWVEGDEESRRAFKDRTRKRQDELAELGWKDAGGAAMQPTSTGDGTASAATAAPSASTAPPGQEAAARPRRRQPARSSAAAAAAAARRLPADIRQELEQLQQVQQVQRTAASAPPRPSQQRDGGAATAHSHQPARTSQHSQRGLPPVAPPRADGPQPQHSHQRHHHHHHHRSHEHFHTCSHPHEDCTSDCCSAPTVAAHSQGTAAAALGAGLSNQLLLQPPASLAALAAALEAAQQAQAGVALPPAPASSSASLLRIWDQLAAGPQPVLPPLALPAVQQPPPPLPLPELPPEVLSLVRDVFLHTKGEAGVAVVVAFLRRQCLTCLSDLEYMELDMLQRGLGADMPPLLLNKFLQLGRRRAGGGGGSAAATSGPQPDAEPRDPDQ